MKTRVERITFDKYMSVSGRCRTQCVLIQ